MSDGIITGAFTLLGVFLGAIINLVTSLLLDKKRGKSEAIALTLCEYEKLCNEMRKYIAEFIGFNDLQNYYFQIYSEREAELKAKQMLYLSKRKRKLIGCINNYIWKLMEEEKIQDLHFQLQNDMEKLK